MTILQTKFYSIPVVIENITASVHITYYDYITPSYPNLNFHPLEVVFRCRDPQLQVGDNY